jgi:hypothetical protein
MQRMWLELTGHGPNELPAAAKLNWSDLHKQIDSLATAQHRDDVLEAMKWAEDQRLKTVRDNVVHSYWWLDGGLGTRGARHTNRGESAIVVGTQEQLHEHAEGLSSSPTGSVHSPRTWDGPPCGTGEDEGRRNYDGIRFAGPCSGG